VGASDGDPESVPGVHSLYFVHLSERYYDFAGLSVRAHVSVSGCVFIQAGEDTVDDRLQESRC